MTVENRPWLKNYPVRWNMEFPVISVYDHFVNQNKDYMDYLALIFMDKKETYREMHDHINRLAAALKDLGVKKGDRVAFMLPNSIFYVHCFYACMKLGAIVVQVNPAYTAHELEFILSDAEAEFFITLDSLYPVFHSIRDKVPVKIVVVCPLGGTKIEGEYHRIDQLMERYSPLDGSVPINPVDDVAVFQYTGGTTGVPKAAMLTHYNLVSDVLMYHEFSSPLLENDSQPPDEQRYMVATLPFFHAFGMTITMNGGLTMPRPTCLVMLTRPDLDQVLPLIKKYQPRRFAAVPTIYNAILNHPQVDNFGLDCLEACSCGSAPISPQLMKRFEEKFNCMILEGFGMSEASPITHGNPLRGERKPGSIGIPYPGTDVKIMDLETGTRELPPGEVGEMVIRGPQVMKGYWKRPEETALALRVGWLYTGDIARMDEDGYFYIVDRKKDVIITGGYNVYPRDVDEVLYQHPKVLEAVTAGIPDEVYGEKVKAYVVLKEGQTATEEEIREFCSQKLARYKVPREVEFRSELPKSAIGKILRRVLVEEEKQKKEEQA